ncbi:hypothetical protein [Duganella sp. LjRoot269]|jgi:hypothetical protein|uniref:hypothetical protein n=1 Tax=Duganella sp. LjRoot269 TaxID=3342305 RepID=UPI003ECD99C7
MITITKRGWEHILKYHSRKYSTKHPKKSTFNDDEDLIQLLNEAALHPPVEKTRRNLVRTLDAGLP